MSINERFTEEELFLLSSVPTMIGSTMAFAENSGLGTVKEMFANAKAYMAGVKTFPDNAIITGILPNFENPQDALSKAKAFQEKALARIKDEGINTPEALKTLLLGDCQAATTLLTQKATEQEASEYKTWAMSVAENVAKAAKEGGFLGFGGETISTGEKEMFAAIASALGVSSTLA